MHWKLPYHKVFGYIFINLVNLLKEKRDVKHLAGIAQVTKTNIIPI